jgi:hypothetical protein
MDEESMARAASFAREHEAHMAKALLASAGIPVYLRDETMNRLEPAVFAASKFAFHLYVPAAALEDARELLDSAVSEKDLEAQAQVGPRGEE